MNQKQWLENIQLEYGADVAASCRGILFEAELKKAEAKRKAELDHMVCEVSVLLGNSIKLADVRFVCASALDLGYRKFEIVEEDV